MSGREGEASAARKMRERVCVCVCHHCHGVCVSGVCAARPGRRVRRRRGGLGPRRGTDNAISTVQALARVVDPLADVHEAVLPRPWILVSRPLWLWNHPRASVREGQFRSEYEFSEGPSAQRRVAQ